MRRAVVGKASKIPPCTSSPEEGSLLFCSAANYCRHYTIEMEANPTGPRLHLMGVVIIAILSLASAECLNYWRPELFLRSATIPAAFSYFAMVGWLLLALRRFPQRAIGAARGKVTHHSAPKQPPYWLAELLFFVVFTVISVCVGVGAGTVWWAVSVIGEMTQALD